MSFTPAASGRLLLGLAALVVVPIPCVASPGATSLDVGVAVRDVTPAGPIWLAGYDARRHASQRVAHPLLAQALALKNPTGERFVFVALDNCEVSREFIAPTVRAIEAQQQLAPGSLMIVCSHTHSGPVVEGPLLWIYGIPEPDLERVTQYSQQLKQTIADVVAAALADLQPAELDYGVGQATFAMNRRQFKGGRVILGEDPDGPVDWDVPVLRVKRSDGAVRAIVFGYACHATTVGGDPKTLATDDWYVVSADYIGYARTHLEAAYPGASAIFLTGMGADSNPAPRAKLLAAQRHGLELAGAVAGVLDRPLRPVRGPFQLAYSEIDLPLADPPPRAQIEQDAAAENPFVRNRAKFYLKLLDEGQPLPKSLPISLAVLRLGEDLTFFAMGGEPVVDYGRRIKRLFAADHPWTIGYAYDIPFYVPTARVIVEGGYEADSSLIYANLYGPFRTQVEDILVGKITELAGAVRGK